MTRRNVGPRVLVACLALTLAMSACGGGAGKSNADLAKESLDRGLQAHAAGKFDEATVAYFETLAKDPKNVLAFYNLGELSQRQNRLVAADGYYRLALEQDPKMGSALFNLAIVRGLAGGYEEAASLYRRVIAIDPNYAPAHFNLGLVLRLLGQTAEAQQELAKAQQLDAKLVAPSPSASPARQATPSPSPTR
jgi:tetratricopeptide (TPR) repeat protein